MAAFSPEDFLDKCGRFSDFTITETHDGENNRNYIFSSDGQRYVLRKRKTVSKDEETLEKERNILKFLKSRGIDFVPQSILYNSEDDVHVIEYVGDREVSLVNLLEEKLEQWVRKLVQIHSLQFSDYREFCEKNRYSYSKPGKSFDKLDNMRLRLEELDRNPENENLIDFIEEKIEYLVPDDRERNIDDFGLMHSDLVSSTRLSDGEIFFIDWEFARFAPRPFTDIAIIFARPEIERSLKGSMMDLYRENAKVPDDFESQIEQSKKFRKVFNILWCLERSQNVEDEREKDRFLDFARGQKFSE